MATQTGTFVTQDELDEIKRLFAASKAASFTAAKLGPQRADDAHEELLKRIYELALEHGLPDIQGYYGLNTSSGEFLTY